MATPEEANPATAVVGQARLLLYQNVYVQQALQRAWQYLATGEKLTMEEFVGYNIRLQKVLVPDFKHDAAIESAVADWQEDIGKGLTCEYEQLSVFLFELAQLWAGFSLQGTLVFLGATVLAVTKAAGPAQATLKPVEDCSLLPSVFFDLLESAKIGAPTSNEAMKAWCAAQLGDEGSLLLSVQRTLFRLLQDGRAVRLFGETRAAPEVVKSPGRTIDALSRAVDAVAHTPAHRIPLVTDARSGRIQLPTGWREYPAHPPPGPKKLVEPRPTAVAKRRPLPRPTPPPKLGPVVGDVPRFRTFLRQPGSVPAMLEPGLSRTLAAATTSLDPESPYPTQLFGTFDRPLTPMSLTGPMEPPGELEMLANDLRDDAVAYGAGPLSLGLPATYELPLVPAEVYQNRVPNMAPPADIVYKAVHSVDPVVPPFQRVLSRLKFGRERPTTGPFLSAEPAWGELQSRLRTVLAKGARRAERRKRRRERKRRGAVKGEGWGMIQYLERKDAEFTADKQAQLHGLKADRSSEFLEQVYEETFFSKEAREAIERRFQVRPKAKRKEIPKVSAQLAGVSVQDVRG